MTKRTYARWRPHPWHGLDIGPSPPWLVNAFIEITPFDTIKYEVDKQSGYLKVDRPQRTSALPPTLYGFVPQTLCGARVAALMEGAASGDNDPLDICVISERPIDRGEVLLRARIVGGIPILDNGQADDKIVAVLDNDYLWGEVHGLADVPAILIERLQHYFTTYKMVPGQAAPVRVGDPYDREHAEHVIAAAIADYSEAFGEALSHLS